MIGLTIGVPGGLKIAREDFRRPISPGAETPGYSQTPLRGSPQFIVAADRSAKALRHPKPSTEKYEF